MKFNGIDITAVDIDGETYLPVKPICEAIGVDSASQRTKMQEDEILSSVGVLSTSTGADGKSYEMLGLPVRYIFGWLFTINPKNVRADARDKVLDYRRRCYDALYDHFAGAAKKAAESARAEADLLRRKSELIEETRALKAEVKRIDDLLDRLSMERTNPQPSLF